MDPDDEPESDENRWDEGMPEMDPQAEIAGLRAENERLRAQNERLRHADAGRRSTAGRWRWPLAASLLALGGVLLALAVPAMWAAGTLLDTDRYTRTVAPLAREPSVRHAVAVSAVDGLFSYVDVETQVRDALPPRADFVAPQMTSGLRDFSVGVADKALATERFRTLWVEANRRAHERLVPALLSGSGARGGVDVSNGTVSVDMADIVGAVKRSLVSQGLTFVQRIPDGAAGGSVTLLRSPQLARVQVVLRALQTLAVALPILALAVLAGAVLAAPDRRRALLWLGLTAILAMLGVGAALALLRDAYVSAPPAGILSGDAAVVFFDTLVRFLRDALRAVAAAGLVLTLAMALAGPSRAAVRVRSAVRSGMGSLGLDLGRPAVWTDRHRRGLDGTILIAAGAVLLAAETPTAGLVLALAVAALAGFLLVELVARSQPAHGPYGAPPSA